MTARGQGWTRREWLQLTGAGALSAATGGRAALQAAAPRPLGVQLYTVRDRMKGEAEATLKAIAEIGYKEIEVGRGDLARLVPMAKPLGLSVPSSHIEAPLVTGNWGPWRDAAKAQPGSLPPDGYGLPQALEEAKAHGVRYVVVSYLMASERGGGVAFYEQFAAQLNRAGEQARKAGLTLGYHNHGFEFEPLPDGRRPLDLLVARTDPALVTLELDVFWAAITGANPAAVLEQYKGRVSLLHLKDTSAGAAKATQEAKVPPTAFAEVGSGTLDFDAILKAAGAVGVKHFIVEQDHTPGDPLASLRKSYQYLASKA